MKLLTLTEIKQSITMQQAIEAMERAFVQLALDQVELPLRTGVPIKEEQGLMLSMPGYLTQDNALGLKVVSIFPKNAQAKKPAIHGLILLIDAKSGEPLALMDGGYLTALRTGAVSGLATQYFAREDASHVAIIGSGVQAFTQLEAVAAVRPIKRVSVWSRHLEHANTFAKRISEQYEVKAYDDVKAAVADADVVCTATSSTEPLIHFQDLAPHVHINAIGSHHRNMREIGDDVLKQASVFVDQLTAALSEAGEIIHAVEHHQLDKASIIEIGQWLLSKDSSNNKKITVFKSVGLAIQDLSVAQVVYQNALRQGLGQEFSLHS